MQSTWQDIVWADTEDARACVYCGSRTSDPRRTIPVALVERILAKQSAVLRADVFSQTTGNICDAATAAHAHHYRDSEKTSEACFVACLCCHHWVERRYKQNIFVLPLQALFWYGATVRAVAGKSMDHRVVRRLCTSLCVTAAGAATNYYWHLFNPSEQRLFAALSALDIDEISNHMSLHYHEQNACSMFTTDCRLVERLRKALHEPAPDE